MRLLLFMALASGASAWAILTYLVIGALSHPQYRVNVPTTRFLGATELWLDIIISVGMTLALAAMTVVAARQLTKP